ncbi:MULTISPECIES: hypothetical protein [unclassified Streptomyces]
MHTQVHLSLQSDFEQYRTFAPNERHESALQQMLTEVVTLTSALAPLRRA